MATIEKPNNFLNGNSSHSGKPNETEAQSGQANQGKQNSSETTAATTTTSDGINLNGQANGGNSKSNEPLKIIGQLKNIEKINEQRRREFLTKTLSETVTTTETLATSSSKEKTELGEFVKTVTTATTGQQEKCQTEIDGNEKSNEKGEQSNVAQNYKEERSIIVHETNGERAVKTNTQTSTLPLIKSPLTPPPKPPMLSRTRSLGVGDQRASVTNFRAVPKTPENSPTSEVDATQSTSEAVVTTVTSSTLPSPAKVSVLRHQESAPALRRTERPSSVLADNPKSVSLNHYERLIEELKCPGCASPMKAPILLCQTGHSICSQCSRILLMCPLCKEPFTNMRSRTVEAMCHKAHFRCCNASGGCNVRLHTEMLPWHEKQCIYKPMKCFMGRVWGDCQWSGREIFWKDHLETAHTDRVFKDHTSDLIWNMGVKQKPLTGYYVFDIYDELFNFYEIYDKDRVLFTMTCTSTMRDRKHNFAFEVTIIHQDNEALAITQKYPVHSEYDKDILADGTCVSIPLNDLAKFIDDEKLLHYRVRVLEVKSPRKMKTPRFVVPNNGMHPVDFQQTQIEGSNLKGVPADAIVTRKDEIPFVDNTLTPSSNGTEVEAGAVGLDDEDVELRRRHYGNEAISRDSSSESDPELEAYIAKKWGTPQLHFNRKFLKDTSLESRSSAEAADKVDDRMSVTSKNTSYTKMKNTIRKSFRSLKTPIVELKFVKKSPEKKSP